MIPDRASPSQARIARGVRETRPSSRHAVIALFVITFAPGLVGPSHRTLADLMAGTRVERAEPVKAAGPMPGRPPPMGMRAGIRAPCRPR